MDNTLKTIRQEVISVAFVAFCAGTQFAFAMAHYLKSPTNLGVSFILCAGFLVGTLFRSLIIWRKLKELELPH